MGTFMQKDVEDLEWKFVHVQNAERINQLLSFDIPIEEDIGNLLKIKTGV